MNFTALLFGALLLFAMGTGAGAWWTGRDLRPALAQSGQNLAVCRAGRGNLEALAAEQGAALGELVKRAQARTEEAARAVAQAEQESAADFSRAQRIQQEHTGGTDQCAAAAAVIDQELGL
ncbi:hypothetical protein ACIPK7_06185 [Pseudomonas sp. NPDC086581]|uniref:hypothetical protein n=1 Tax=Pseudomonas sp. NPDC086581 TaxID=3364432 RepID=UPI0037F3CEA3